MTNLAKYFFNLIHSDDIESVRKQENRKSDNDIAVALENLWNEEMQKKPALDADAIEALEKSKNIVMRTVQPTMGRGKTRAIALWIMSAAAVVLLFISITAIWKYNSFSDMLMSHQVEMMTGTEDTTSVKMPDGTRIRVMGGSCLAYPTAFTGKYRRVALRGEAYFSVTHDSKHPFVVESNGFEVTVKGTKFNLRAKQQEGYSTVWLDEGRVDIKSVKTGESLTLHPGQKAMVDSKTGKLSLQQADYNGIHTSWLAREVTFHNTPFHDVLNTVCANYGLSLVLDKDVSNVPFTGTLPNNNLSEVIRTLEIVYKVNINVSLKVMSVR